MSAGGCSPATSSRFPTVVVLLSFPSLFTSLPWLPSPLLYFPTVASLPLSPLPLFLIRHRLAADRLLGGAWAWVAFFLRHYLTFTLLRIFLLTSAQREVPSLQVTPSRCSALPGPLGLGLRAVFAAPVILALRVAAQALHSC